ncbi:Nn.00g090320.m01.CDS01 [Neocucurbitaria sp. VM-36]
MASQEVKEDDKIYALVNYEDPYVQPLILAALEKRLPPETLELISSLTQLPSPTSRLLQFVQYESIDFDQLMEYSSTSLANAYVIRKALIRKHYLSTTIANWIVKYQNSVLKKHVKPSVEFEVDYAEFLDDALIEAWELKESWAKNETTEEPSKRDWWILKPGMSERGQGIRLFSSEEELTSIFEEWDPESDEEEEEYDETDIRSDDEGDCASEGKEREDDSNGIMTSQLRHFIAQPYIHPPLLLQPPSSTSTKTSIDSSATLRKFHIRTYVLATAALQVYVYRPMLALFAARSYVPPWDQVLQEDRDEAMRAHLTNTCLQDSGDREGSVGLFWELPIDLPAQPDFTGGTTRLDEGSASKTWKERIFEEICQITGETFEAAARGMSIHFQPLPNAFEVFGLDFMVGVEPNGELRTYLLEVNAFPDFRQTGDELQGLVKGLLEGVVEKGIMPFFAVGEYQKNNQEEKARDMSDRENMVKVLDIDLGRR